VQFSQTAILSSDKVVRRSCAMLVWRRCWREYPISDKYLGPPYSRTKIYAARVSYAAADDAHRAPLDGFAAAARAAPGTDRRTDRWTRYRFNTLTAYAIRVINIGLTSRWRHWSGSWALTHTPCPLIINHFSYGGICLQCLRLHIL